jgi:four helix bundle protein
MKDFRHLEIFKESRRLALIVHKMSLTFPKFELYEEGSQLRRASKAITSLIVEGYGRRRYKADFIRLLIISQAECDEVIVHLDFVFETESFKDKDLYESLREQYDLLSKRINKFIQWVDSHQLS